MCDLLLHRHSEQHEEVQQQNGPEDRHVEESKECHENGDEDGLGATVPAKGVIRLGLHHMKREAPELEFRHLSHEGPMFVIFSSGEQRILVLGRYERN